VQVVFSLSGADVESSETPAFRVASDHTPNRDGDFMLYLYSHGFCV